MARLGSTYRIKVNENGGLREDGERTPYWIGWRYFWSRMSKRVGSVKWKHRAYPRIPAGVLPQIMTFAMRTVDERTSARLCHGWHRWQRKQICRGAVFENKAEQHLGHYVYDHGLLILKPGRRERWENVYGVAIHTVAKLGSPTSPTRQPLHWDIYQ